MRYCKSHVNMITILIVLILLIQHSDSLETDYCSCTSDSLLKNEFYTYSDVPISLPLLCVLRGKSNISIISTDYYHELVNIRSEYHGECLEGARSESELIIHDRLDSRVDFPIGYGQYADKLRARILSCVPDVQKMDSRLPEVNSLALNIVRNTIDYFSGLTTNSMRLGILLPSSDPKLATGLYSCLESRNYPSRSSITKFQDHERILNVRSLQFDPFTSLDYYLNLAMSFFVRASYAKEIANFAQVIRSIFVISQTLNDNLQLGSSILSFIATDKQFKDKTLSDIDKRLLENQQVALEARSEQLLVLKNILENSIATNKFLRIISGQLDQIQSTLEELEKELEEVNKELDRVTEKLEDVVSELEKINSKLDDIIESIDSHKNPDDLNMSDYNRNFSKSYIEVLTGSNIISDYSELVNEYENLKCDDFVSQKKLIQQTCFMYFFLELRNDKISESDYLRYRFDSTLTLGTGNSSEDCLILGANHPKFSSLYFSTNLTLASDISSMNSQTALDHIYTSSLMFKYLYYDIARGYNTDWYFEVFNLVRMNRGFRPSEDEKDNVDLERIIIRIASYESICF